MPSQVRITPWVDPVIDVLGHDPRSWYVETFWLPTLGPTSLLVLRHLADRFEEHPEGLALPVADTAAALGLGPRDGEQSPLVRTIDRLHQFDLAHRLAPDVIAVRRVLPPVNRRHVRRLPVALQARHRDWVTGQTADGPVELARRRARRIALTLLLEGETLDGVERALHRGGFHPALAHEAVRWARERDRAIDEDARRDASSA
jgi:hypothetical protein